MPVDFEEPFSTLRRTMIEPLGALRRTHSPRKTAEGVWSQATLQKQQNQKQPKKRFVARVGEKEQETFKTEWLRGQGSFSEQGYPVWPAESNTFCGPAIPDPATAWLQVPPRVSGMVSHQSCERGGEGQKEAAIGKI